MFLRLDRILLRVSHLQSAIRFYHDVLNLTLVKEDARIAAFRLDDGQTELVLHCDDDLPAEANYFLVADVRDLYRRRDELKLTFLQSPSAVARGYRAAIRDPSGNALLIVDRTNEPGANTVIEDARAPGALFPGVEEKPPSNREMLIRAYQQVNRTADDLPYTADFERLYMVYSNSLKSASITREEVWRQLLNLRKGSHLPRLGEARSTPPPISDEHRQRLREMLGEDIGRRDRLPYTQRFDRLVDEFNRTQSRPLSPHLVWRLVATLAK
jgi:catechol 2,3-dioxygenase-like lactoylglutathione lyase family enzyme